MTEIKTNKGRINSLDSEIFKKLIAESNSWVKVLTYFKDNHGYKNICQPVTARNRCIRENIDYSHFTRIGHKKDYEEILIKNKSFSSSELRKRLVKDKLLENKCRDCGIGPEYNGKSLTLQLEHIDGDHFNNTIENLTVLCPNCHSQTKTWGARNKTFKKEPNKCPDCNKNIQDRSFRCSECHKIMKTKEKEINTREIKNGESVSYKYQKNKHCKDCDTEISDNATWCRSCSSKNNCIKKVPNRPSVEQLNEDLKELPMTKVGLKYGVSDNCIRNWIKT
jgi:hypothetical protein